MQYSNTRSNGRVSFSKKQTLTPTEKCLADVRARFDIHDRPFTRSDFFRICKAERIVVNVQRLTAKHAWLAAIETVLLDRPSVQGYYTAAGEFPIIILRCLASGEPFDVETAFHELGHHFMGHASAYKFASAAPDDRREREADLFAELALGKVAGGIDQ